MRTPSTTVRAAVAGRAALLDGSVDTAIARCGDAVTGFAEMGAPYEAATARLVLGAAYQRDGRDHAAHMEWAMAQAAFERFGARLRAGQAAALAARHTATAAVDTGSGRVAAPGVQGR